MAIGSQLSRTIGSHLGGFRGRWIGPLRTLQRGTVIWKCLNGERATASPHPTENLPTKHQQINLCDSNIRIHGASIRKALHCNRILNAQTLPDLNNRSAFSSRSIALHPLARKPLARKPLSCTISVLCLALRWFALGWLVLGWLTLGWFAYFPCG